MSVDPAILDKGAIVWSVFTERADASRSVWVPPILCRWHIVGGGPALIIARPYGQPMVRRESRTRFADSVYLSAEEALIAARDELIKIRDRARVRAENANEAMYRAAHMLESRYWEQWPQTLTAPQETKP